MAATNSEIVVVRLTRRDVRDLDRLAHAKGLKRSELIRAVLKASLSGRDNLEREAARQSQLASRATSEKDAAEFVAGAMATDGWS